MNCLILDTSTDLCIVAVTRGDELVAHEIFPHKNLLSETLLPAIQSLVGAVCGSPQNLSAIAFGNGPGSYTGTRLGAAVAKSLAFGIGLPIKVFFSPLAFLPDREGNFAFVLPAHSGQLYVVTGTIVQENIDQEKSFWVSPDETDPFANIDFLICPDRDKLNPSIRKDKPCYSPAPNVLLLARWLSTKAPISSEQTQLVYLGTPS